MESELFHGHDEIDRAFTFMPIAAKVSPLACGWLDRKGFVFAIVSEWACTLPRPLHLLECRVFFYEVNQVNFLRF